MSEWSRREFLKFMGRSGLVAAAAPVFSGCASLGLGSPNLKPFSGLKPTLDDQLFLSPELKYEILLRYNQPINSKEYFGFNNDYIAYIPFSTAEPSRGLMWVNHEYHDPYFVSGWRPGQARTVEQFGKERKSVGGSIVEVYQTVGKWRFEEKSKYNRRLDGFTSIPLISDRPIFGAKVAQGTLGNCAGGVTPWGTVLTCEENYDNFVGEVHFEGGKRTIKPGDDYLCWTTGYSLPPEHYGWVVEVDLKSGAAKKLTALGRFAHECATCTTAPDGRAVVYSGDDTENEHLYKFISTKPGSLESGQLYVASLTERRWIPLNWQEDDRLKKAFSDKTEMLIRTREAAKIVGATPLDRPEDIEIDPVSRALFVSLTNNKKNENYFGSLMKIVEKDSNPLSLEFDSYTFLAGGPETGFACPDNLAFDAKGNLWMCTDMSGSAMGEAPYENYGNNGLFFIPLSGPQAGIAVQVASAPRGAEMTGPCFSPDGKTLFLSIQHPGERGHKRAKMLSTWPDGGSSDPVPCVVAISGVDSI